jgi:hypothetical protein
MHLNQLADCLLLFKRTMGSIETLQKEDVNFLLIYFFHLKVFFVFLQAALRMEAQKMNNEISFYQEEIASNKEQIELVRNLFEIKESKNERICFF